jgi:hypothetical protein
VSVTAQPSILDARLAEIDQRLRRIQTGLAADRAEPGVPRSAPPPPQPLPPRVELPSLTREPAADLIAELRSLAAIQERLVASLRELAQIPAAAPTDARSDVVAVSVGPLESTQALRAFERALSGLTGVRAVRVRGYEGGNRALLDVHLT